jgi:hypothetical protein
MLSEYQQTLAGIQSSASDDCVRLVTENGKEFGETRDKVRKLRESLDGEAIGVLRQARQATDQVWQPLQVGMDNGARRALVPLENKRNFLDVSGDIVERVDPVFFSDPMTAAMKALGMN